MLTKTRTGLKPGREGGPDYDAAAEFSGVTHDLSARPPSLPRSEVTTLRRRPSKGHNCKVIPPLFPPSKSETERGLTSVFFRQDPTSHLPIPVRLEFIQLSTQWHREGREYI